MEGQGNERFCMEQVIITKDNMGLFDIRPLIRLFSTLRAGQYMVEVKRHRNQRTNEQNKWLWGCIYPMMLSGFIAIGWDDFTDTEQVHEYCKLMFGRKKHVNKHTGEVVEIPDSTAQMTTLEFAEYCEQLRSFAKEYLSIEIPDPNTTIK